MGETTTPTLWDSITTVITNIMTCLGNVASSLMNNQLFQITLGVVVFGIILGVVFTLVRKIRKRGR